MKIYTKTGDAGTTSLIGGTRVSKSEYRIEAYGTVDELMAHIGYLYDQYENNNDQLIEILDRLMSCASILASEDQNIEKLPTITEQDITNLENWTDGMLAEVPQIQHFTLPAGDASMSYTHICRTVCRRAERAAIRSAENGSKIPSEVFKYINRLSDYLYALGRYLAQKNSAKELIWNPRVPQNQ